MTIDYKDDREREIIEKTLADYGQLISKSIEPRDFFDDPEHILQFEIEQDIVNIRQQLVKERRKALEEVNLLKQELTKKDNEIQKVLNQKEALNEVIGNLFLIGTPKSYDNVENAKTVEFLDLAVFKKMKILFKRANFEQLFDVLDDLFFNQQNFINSQNFKKQEQQFCQLCSQYNSLKEKLNLSLVSEADALPHRNKIMNSLWELICDIEDEVS